jgi:hypothetical protein
MTTNQMQIMIGVWIRPPGRRSPQRLAKLADTLRRLKRGTRCAIEIRDRWVKINIDRDRRLRPGQPLTFERINSEVDAVVRRFKLAEPIKRGTLIVHVDFGVKYWTMTCSIGHSDASQVQPSICVSFYPCT